MMSQWELLKKRGMLLGSGSWRLSWDVFMTIVVILSVILTPYRIAFERVRVMFHPFAACLCLFEHRQRPCTVWLHLRLWVGVMSCVATLRWGRIKIRGPLGFWKRCWTVYFSWTFC